MDISLLTMPDGWEAERDQVDRFAERLYSMLGIPAHLIYAVPTIVGGGIVEVSLVRKPADPHVPPIKPIE